MANVCIQYLKTQFDFMTHPDTEYDLYYLTNVNNTELQNQ